MERARYRQEAEVAFENMGCPWMLRSWALQDPASVILHETDPCHYTLGSYKAQYKYSTVSSTCTLAARAWPVWKVIFGLRRNSCYRRKSQPIFLKGVSGQRCRSLSEAEDAQMRCHWLDDLCSTFKSCFRTMSSLPDQRLRKRHMHICVLRGTFLSKCNMPDDSLSSDRDPKTC